MCILTLRHSKFYFWTWNIYVCMYFWVWRFFLRALGVGITVSARCIEYAGRVLMKLFRDYMLHLECLTARCLEPGIC
jgi:hypothetical protein